MNEVSFDLKHICHHTSLVCQNNQISNLGAEIFVVCKGTINKDKELSMFQVKSDIFDASVHVFHLLF